MSTYYGLTPVWHHNSVINVKALECTLNEKALLLIVIVKLQSSRKFVSSSNLYCNCNCGPGELPRLHRAGVPGDGLARPSHRPASGVPAQDPGKYGHQCPHQHWRIVIFNDDDDDGVLQGSLGGGVIQTTASESTFVCLLAGRTEAIKRYQVQM